MHSEWRSLQSMWKVNKVQAGRESEHCVQSLVLIKYQPNATLCTQNMASLSDMEPECDDLPSQRDDVQRHGSRFKYNRVESGRVEYILCMLVEELLGLVDLGGQVRAATAVGVVE